MGCLAEDRWPQWLEAIMSPVCPLLLKQEIQIYFSVNLFWYLVQLANWNCCSSSSMKAVTMLARPCSAW